MCFFIWRFREFILAIWNHGTFHTLRFGIFFDESHTWALKIILRKSVVWSHLVWHGDFLHCISLKYGSLLLEHGLIFYNRVDLGHLFVSKPLCWRVLARRLWKIQFLLGKICWADKSWAKPWDILLTHRSDVLRLERVRDDWFLSICHLLLSLVDDALLKYHLWVLLSRHWLRLVHRVSCALNGILLGSDVLTTCLLEHDWSLKIVWADCFIRSEFVDNHGALDLVLCLQGLLVWNYLDLITLVQRCLFLFLRFLRLLPGLFSNRPILPGVERCETFMALNRFGVRQFAWHYYSRFRLNKNLINFFDIDTFMLWSISHRIGIILGLMVIIRVLLCRYGGCIF